MYKPGPFVRFLYLLLGPLVYCCDWLFVQYLKLWKLRLQYQHDLLKAENDLLKAKAVERELSLRRFQEMESSRCTGHTRTEGTSQD